MKNSRIIKITSLLFCAILWHVLSLYIHNTILFPAPLDVIRKIAELAAGGELVGQFTVTALRTIAGLTVSIISGVMIGILFGMNRRLYEFFSPVTVFFQSAPAISWILLAIIWLSASLTPVFLIIASTLPIIITSTAEGIFYTDKKLLEMAKIYSLPSSSVVKSIYLPQLAGYIFSSLRISAGLAFKSAVMAEVLSYPASGIGTMMSRARIDVDTTAIFAWTVIIIAGAFLLDSLIHSLHRRFAGD